MAILLAGAAVAAVMWVVATTPGTRWLLTSVANFSGVSLSAEKIEGRIIDHLLLTEVRVGLTHQRIEIDSFELRWKPLLLLAGTAAFQEIFINGVRIQDDTPPDNKPPVPVWPSLPESVHLFDGRITRLSVTNVSYRRLQEQLLAVADISGSVNWQDSILTVADLKVLSSYGQLKGTFSAGFKQPYLKSDLAVTLLQPVAEMDQFTLLTGQSHVKGSEQFAGTFTIAGSSGSRKLLELGGEVGMARDAINLRRLGLTRPGQKGLVTADGSLAFKSLEPVLSLQVKATGLDLAPELNVPTDLSGTVRFKGTLDSYQGDFTLANQAQGWKSAVVSANYRGTRETMRLAPLTGSIIDGTLAGNLDMNWHDGFELRGMISGSNLNPARLDPGWKGVVNFSATGFLSKVGKLPLTGSVSGALLESRLHGQALTGLVRADFVDNNFSFDRLALKGKGFDLHASGDLKQKLVMAAKISDFSRLVPGSSGTLQADGWVRWSDRQVSGAVAGTGSNLAYAGTRVAAANLTARLDRGTGYPVHVNAALRKVVYEGYTLDAVTLAADGTLQHHTVNAALRSAGSDAQLALAAGYNAGIWKGDINSLSGSDQSGSWHLKAPAAFAISAGRFSLSTLVLTAGAAERLEVAADLALNPLGGQVLAEWAGLNLARAKSYLKDVRITGNSNGAVRLGFLPGKRLTLAGSAAGNGTFTGKDGSMTLQQGLLTFDGSEQGMLIGIELRTADGGRLKGNFSSPAPLRLAMPEKGDLTAEVSGIDLALLKTWLPRDTRLDGRISGRAKGVMLPGQRFELDGNAVLSEGKFHQDRPEGELNLTFKSATASWGWRGETLTGNVSLTMAEYGQARANFQLPVPAHFPVALNPKGPLQASFTGKLREKGVITALFPGLVQESSGEIDVGLVVNGTWEVPQVGGTLRLTRAGAYLPTAGIHLKDVQLAAQLEKDLIRIDSFRALSGPGHIEGTALLTLKGWRVIGYQGTIRGKNFQTIFFPELQVQTTPNLTFDGTPEKLSLRGELSLPDLHIVGVSPPKVVASSSDVILEGRVAPVAKRSPLALDVQVRAVLGEKVFVKISGIDAQLGGALDISFSSLDNINSSGEIKVVKGRYRTYGVNLDIVRGRLFFAGGSIDRPTLDFLALRTIGNVRAGVTVAGNLQKPVTKLYSEPAMPDVDVLAYIVLGHPLGSSGEQAGLLAQAAGAMLTSGQAEVLQDKIKNKLGLSTLEIQGGVGATTSHMGYKPLQVTPPGAIPATQQPGITETMLTVGKYLTPQLYVSYGKSVFTGGNLFLLRYDIFKHWQVETQTGSESGADLFYKLEFN
jgi:translocation and assembly module TamB